ncbi:hypothetical protein B0H12DRAFT_1077989, partial [Mycena haematopus]
LRVFSVNAGKPRRVAGGFIASCWKSWQGLPPESTSGATIDYSVGSNSGGMARLVYKMFSLFGDETEGNVPEGRLELVMFVKVPPVTVNSCECENIPLACLDRNSFQRLAALNGTNDKTEARNPLESAGRRPDLQQ